MFISFKKLSETLCLKSKDLQKKGNGKNILLPFQFRMK